MTIQQAIYYGEKLLEENGVNRPRWNAERLLLLALRQDRSKIYAELNRYLTYEESQDYEKLIRKRAEHFPLAYIEGVQEFYGREFYVNQSVLIPRPETEEIIRAILSLKLPDNPRILDLGAGSGCIAAILQVEIPTGRIFAAEVSPEAITVLRKNAPKTVGITQGDMFAAPFLSSSFDVIASNPPYVEAVQFRELPAETRWEPALALLTKDLKKTYSGIVRQAERLLKQGGYLVFEIGYGQSERVQAICGGRSKMKLLQIRKDFRGVPRTFTLQKQG